MYNDLYVEDIVASFLLTNRYTFYRLAFPFNFDKYLLNRSATSNLVGTKSPLFHFII